MQKKDSYDYVPNMGVVIVPEKPGYRCCEKTGVWMIDAIG
jgi:hypothetical protein